MSDTNTSGISATDAGLSGFKILREKPMVWPAWAIASMAISILTAILMVTLAGPALAEITELSRSATPDPQALFPLYAKLGPAMLAIAPIFLAFYAVLYAAASRIVLRPEDRGFGWMKLGGDEVRQGLALIAISLILIGAYLGVIIAAALLGAVAGMISPVLGGLIAVLAFLAALGGLIYVAIRLSFVSPATFATGRIDIRAAWALTKGRVGTLFGAYLLSLVMAIIIGVVGTGAFFLVGMLVFGLADTAKAVLEPDMTSMSTMFPPASIAYYIWSAVVSGITAVIAMAPAPTLYRQIVGGEQTVFD